jgi:dGTPase
LREGIVKHETEYDVSSAQSFDPDKRGLLEAQIANAADEIAYNAHDLDDGLRAKLFTPDELDGIELWERVKHSVGWDGAGFDEMWRHRLIRRLIGLEVTDVINATEDRITTSAYNQLRMCSCSITTIGFSAQQQINRGLKFPLSAHVSARVSSACKQGRRLLGGYVCG